MNKKLIVVLTMTLILALTAPVMARSFNDVPANHWAQDAVKQVAEAGIIRGFNDGTYQGEQPLSRYQMATVTAGILEEMEEENNEINQDMMEVINKLAEEFDKEIVVINERLEQEDVLTILGETGLEYNQTEVSGADAYENPFDFDEDDPDLIEAEDYFKQYATLGLNVEQDGLMADIELKTVGDYFGNFEDDNALTDTFVLDEITGEIKTEDFAATIGNEQDLDWRDYLYAEEDNIDGVVLTAKDSIFALGKRGDTRSIAARHDGLFDLPINTFLGREDEADDSNLVLGLGSELEFNNFDLSGEFALNNGEENGQLFKLGAGTDLGLVNLAGNYKYAEQFVGIQADEDFNGDVSGYDVKASSQVDKVELGAKYEDYEGDELTLTADVDEENPYQIFNVSLFGNYENRINAAEQLAYLEGNKELSDISLAAIYDYEDSEDETKADKVLSFAYQPEFEVVGVQLSPEVKLATIFDLDNEQYLNKEAGVKAGYEVNDRVKLNSGLNWAEKEARVDLAGRLATAEAGLEYKISEDTSANVNYERTNFHGEDSNNDYNAEAITAGVNVKF